MYARLISPPQTFDEKIAAACERIVSAMTTYPELLVASSDRLDTEMMRAWQVTWYQGLAPKVFLQQACCL